MVFPMSLLCKLYLDLKQFSQGAITVFSGKVFQEEPRSFACAFFIQDFKEMVPLETWMSQRMLNNLLNTKQ